MGATDLRRSTRREVDYAGEINAGRNHLYGSVLDLSTHGAFFRTESGLINDEWIQLQEPWKQFHVGDRIHIEVHSQGRLWKSPAVVQWVGISDGHLGPGLGLRFIGQLNPAPAEAQAAV